MKVFVTGATGVIGRPTVAAAGRGRPRGPARSPGGEKPRRQLRAAGAEPVAVDLFDADAVRDAVVGSRRDRRTSRPTSRRSRRLLRPKAWDDAQPAPHRGDRATSSTRPRGTASARIVKESITFVYADGGDAWLDEASPLIADLGADRADARGRADRARARRRRVGDAVVAAVRPLLRRAGNRGTDEMLRLARWRRSMVAGQAAART